MIDYEKLNIANELAKKHYDHSGSSVVIETNASYGCHNDKFILHLDRVPFIYENIDDLIAKLEELTKPEPKYNVGDKVAYIDEDNKPQEFVIEGICDFMSPCYWESKENDLYHLEHQLYPTKEDLINAQIAYWYAMRKPVECQHEPQPDFVHPGSPGFKKGYVKMCVKCHEEYVECQHESDGYAYSMITESKICTSPGIPSRFKCTKCGEFYR